MAADIHQGIDHPFKRINLIIPYNEITWFLHTGKNIGFFPLLSACIVFEWMPLRKFKNKISVLLIDEILFLNNNYNQEGTFTSFMNFSRFTSDLWNDLSIFFFSNNLKGRGVLGFFFK